ncbi:MAG: DNA recombination protein RmuC [Planctomycetota bacterium]|jgi:DNA recombination protein RmuC
MDFAIGLIVGLALGAALVLVVVWIRSRSDAARQEAVEQRFRETFAALAADALDANSKRLTDQAAQTLDGKKALIDQAVKAVNERLTQLATFMQTTEAERKKDVGSLTTSISSLSTTTGELHRMLASSQRRGAWGERMAEDILRLAGLAEKVNYVKQSSAEADTGRPDFTFFLPNDYRVNMDVKFPLDAFKTYVDADTDDARDAALKQLTAAVRGHIRTVASRGYIDPNLPTVDYVIVFIPSEQIFALALSAEPDLMDEALQRKVVLAGPLTLYAMLAVIRQAAERAVLMAEAGEVLGVLNDFSKQWEAYNEHLDKLGERLRQTAEQFETVAGVRTRQLQRQIDKISDLQLPSENEQG